VSTKAAREKLLRDAGINVRDNSGRFVNPDDEQDTDK